VLYSQYSDVSHTCLHLYLYSMISSDRVRYQYLANRDIAFSSATLGTHYERRPSSSHCVEQSNKIRNCHVSSYAAKAMSSVPLKLDTLPAEIIKRIASWAPCESVLALLRVNRRLYRECNDHVVFKNVIMNRSGIGSEPVWDISFLSGNTSASDCARFALADALAWKLVARCRFEESEDNSNRDSDHEKLGVSLWGPQLVALHHPFIKDPAVYPASLDLHFKAGITDWQHSLEDIAGGNLCVTANILHHEFLLKEPESPSLFHRLEEDWINLIQSSEDAEERPTTAILSCSLIRSFCGLPLKVLLPVPTKIPFSSFTPEEFLLPFAGQFFRSPETSYLKTMTSKEFLEDGEWVGFFGHSTRLEHPSWAAPLVDIRFTTSPHAPSAQEGEQSTDDSSDTDSIPEGVEVLNLEFHGAIVEDLEPEAQRLYFKLSGQIRSTGRIDMVWTGEHTQPYDWNSWMTPYGMVGFWGTNNSDHGPVWIWKKAWTASESSD